MLNLLVVGVCTVNDNADRITESAKLDCVNTIPFGLRYVCCLSKNTILTVRNMVVYAVQEG